jgi:hypothetical protein
MNHLTVASILKRQIQIGNNKFPAVLIPVMGCFLVITMGLNAIYLKRYYKVMSYFEKFYPEIYQRIRIKPDFGSLYFTGNKVKPLIDFAKHHEPLNDPKAEKMLADFIEFDRQTTWLGLAIMIISFVGFVVIEVTLRAY